jgi:hypothetical protein
MSLSVFALIASVMTVVTTAGSAQVRPVPSAVLSDEACPAAAKPLSRIGYLMSRQSAQAEAQLPEMLDKAYDAELDCARSAAQTYAASPTVELFRAALLAKLKLALLMSWTAEADARSGDVETAHEIWLDALDVARFAYDATTGEDELTGMRAGAATVCEEIAADLEEVRRSSPAVTRDTANDEVEDAERVVRTQRETALVEAGLDEWERRSRHKTFDGADVIETVDGSTTLEIRTDRQAWSSRKPDERRATLKSIVEATQGAILPGPLGFVLKLVDAEGQTLVAVRMPRDLASIAL